MFKQNTDMKRIIVFLLIFTPVIFFSCEDYLDQTPDGEISLEEVFADREYTRDFLYNVYSYCPDELMMAWHSWMELRFNLTPFQGASDEMDFSWTTPYSQNMNNGSWSPNDRGTFSSVSTCWYWYYQGIRRSNQFIVNVDNSPAYSFEKQEWKGEAYFLRAFYHFLLFRIYGPIPIVDHTVSVDADFNTLLRSPIDDIVKFIVDDCDRAASMLEPTVSPDQLGRTNRLAALALKARVLLYAASDFYNGNTWYAEFKDKDGEPFFSQTHQQSKWAEAAEAALQCITEAEAAGRKLHEQDNDPVLSYQYLFINAENTESLFQKMIGWDNNFEHMAMPVGQGGWSGLNPSQNIVDAYEMQSTGESPVLGYHGDNEPIINPAASDYIEEGYVSDPHPRGWYPAGIRNMYVGRDPRFYASIVFNGQMLRGRQVEFHATGKDRGTGPDFPSTGYLLKKFVGPTTDAVSGRWDNKICIYFRLGEMYLNYAEAINEAEGPEKAYSYINDIRARVNMPALPNNLNKDDMREKIRHERRIELAFEGGHRYFDTHRWKIAEESEGIKIYGMDRTKGTSLKDDRFYNRVVSDPGRVFESPKHYIWPIPQHEINKNQNLLQAPEW